MFAHWHDPSVYFCDEIDVDVCLLKLDATKVLFAYKVRIIFLSIETNFF